MVHPAPDDRIDPSCEVRFGQVSAKVQSPGPHLSADPLEGLPADCGQERPEHLAVPGDRGALPEREPQERELNVLMRATPAVVLAAGDPGFLRVQGQPYLSHPFPDRRQHVPCLALADAVDHRESRRGESHPPPLAEPCGSLSAYTAPIVQPSGLRPK